MRLDVFHTLLDRIVAQLTREARSTGFRKALEFEQRVREVTQDIADRLDGGAEPELLTAYPENFPLGLHVDMHPPAQAFPDIVLGDVGIEVKFTESDTWRCIANSVLETNKVHSVKHICVVYCKMGGTPEVRYDDWEKAVMHVRTSHVPRFEIEIGSKKSLFAIMGISYDDFSALEMSEKMKYIRNYAKGRLKEGEHLWWIDETAEEAEQHALSLGVRLYTNLTVEEKTKIRAEAVLLSPGILKSGRDRHKYDDVVMFMMTYHGVLCHQVRDLFSAGSAAGVGGNGIVRETPKEYKVKGKHFSGIYILRALLRLEEDMRKAAGYLDIRLFEEYWGEETVQRYDMSTTESRLAAWLDQADAYAKGWKPSDYLFLDVTGR